LEEKLNFDPDTAPLPPENLPAFLRKSRNAVYPNFWTDFLPVYYKADNEFQELQAKWLKLRLEQSRGSDRKGLEDEIHEADQALYSHALKLYPNLRFYDQIICRSDKRLVGIIGPHQRSQLAA